MKDAKLVALAEAQWIRSYVRLLMGSGMILLSLYTLTPGEFISELLPPTRHRLQPFLYHSKALQIFFRSIPLSPGNSNICLKSV